MPIHGLGPVGAKKEESKDKEEFSVGGGQSSTAVQRPTGALGDLVRSAGQAGGTDPTGSRDRSIGTITVYANGYILGDDGEFKDAKDPQNAAAIEALKGGHVPKSMEEEVRAKWGPQVQSVGLSLVDKMSEHFTPPPPKFDFAKSQGKSLGGSSSAPVDLGSLTPCEYKLPDGEKPTTIQVILADRKKLRLQIALTATVAHLYQHVMQASSEPSFSLAGGFPPKPLTNYGATIAEAGLAGASVTQRKI